MKFLVCRNSQVMGFWKKILGKFGLARRRGKQWSSILDFAKELVFCRSFWFCVPGSLGLVVVDLLENFCLCFCAWFPDSVRGTVLDLLLLHVEISFSLIEINLLFIWKEKILMDCLLNGGFSLDYWNLSVNLGVYHYVYSQEREEIQTCVDFHNLNQASLIKI